MYRILTAAVFALVLAGCETHKAGPFEKTGERADEIKDNIEEGRPALHKKTPLEKTGEAIDDTLGTNNRNRN